LEINANINFGFFPWNLTIEASIFDLHEFKDRKLLISRKIFSARQLSIKHQLYLPTGQQLIAEVQKEIDRMDQKERE
jgi:hypothetical protein